MAKGEHVWQGGLCGKGGGRGSAWQGGMHGRGLRGMGSCVVEACVAGEMATAAEEYLAKLEVGEPSIFGGNVPIWFVLNKNESYACY